MSVILFLVQAIDFLRKGSYAPGNTHLLIEISNIIYAFNVTIFLLCYLCNIVESVVKHKNMLGD